MQRSVILSGARTPFGKLGGELASLQAVELAAMMHGYRRRQTVRAGVLLRLVGDDEDRPHAFADELLRDAGDR